MPASGEPFEVHSRVSHPTWGLGQVTGYEGDTVTLFSESTGYKTLAVDLVDADGLLTHDGGVTYLGGREGRSKRSH